MPALCLFANILNTSYYPLVSWIEVTRPCRSEQKVWNFERYLLLEESEKDTCTVKAQKSHRLAGSCYDFCGACYNRETQGPRKTVVAIILKWGIQPIPCLVWNSHQERQPLETGWTNCTISILVSNTAFSTVIPEFVGIACAGVLEAQCSSQLPGQPHHWSSSLSGLMKEKETRRNEEGQSKLRIILKKEKLANYRQPAKPGFIIR